MRYVTLWSKSKANHFWLIERSMPYKFVLTMGLPEKSGSPIVGHDDRLYAWFDQGIDPNNPMD